MPCMNNQSTRQKNLYALTLKKRMMMNQKLKNDFLKKWGQYFRESELPLAFYYTENPGNISRANLPKGHSCIICELAIVRKGTPLAWNAHTLACGGASRYLGYTETMRPDFEYFLSTGIPGKMKGERYIRNPEMVREIMHKMRCFPAKGKFIVFKRYDQLTPEEEPLAIIFFAKPDVISGLFTLANFDQPQGNGVISPFGSGCASIVYHAIQENKKKNPKAILGMFDPSARACVPNDILTFSIPIKKFKKMVSYMEESFLITSTWDKIKNRL